MEHLPKPVLEQVIAYFDSRLNDETVAPGGLGGKKAYFQGAVGRTNFLPKELQVEVDAHRGDTPQSDYLFKHILFEGKYSAHRD